MASTLLQIRNTRLEKLSKLRELGINPYPAKSEKDYPNQEVLDKFDELTSMELTVSGRLISWREHGQIAFGHLQDETGRLQLFVKSEELSPTSKDNQAIGFGDLNLLDVGDFIQVTGKLGKTTRGEKSLIPREIKILTKSLRPLPDKWEGLSDIETRFRKRYVDTTINREVFERFLRRAKFWEAHREFFKSHGFVEMNIPVLEHVPGGGDANPFVTHMDVIDEDFYLRISQELYLKRLIGGGYERVYEIGPRFRNEGLSDEHLPEHMAMEFYWAYAEYKQGMEFIKDLFNYVIKKVYGDKKIFKIRGFEVDFSKGWEVIDFGEIFKQHYGVNSYDITLEEVEKLLKEHNIERDFEINIPRGVDNLWKKIRGTIAGPAFLTNHPKYLSPLQKPSELNSKIVERFQPIIAGSELGNGWSEVNDPIDQYERFLEQQRLRDAGDKEAQWLDIDYVEMLEYGMPPTFGYGHSERVFWFLEDVTAREGVPFPSMRFKLDDYVKEIYPDFKLPKK